MVLKIKKMRFGVIYCSLAIFSLLTYRISSSAQPRVQKENRDYRENVSSINEPHEGTINQDMLAELITVLLLENKIFQIVTPFFPISSMSMAPIDDSAGPFFFSNGDIYAVAVAEWDDRDVRKWADDVFRQLNVDKYIIVKIVMSNGAHNLTVSKTYDIINVVRKDYSIERFSYNNKIRLTPQETANTLSLFSQWEGIRFDDKVNSLTFFGSNKNKNPQISTSDLIAAYKAIFIHEAAGEALFVDMDFSGGDSEYLVTFGGGFEDTRLGRVLLAADLLLKALSSGIDPWSPKRPLVEEICELKKKNTFQHIFCEDIRPFVTQKRTDLDKERIEKAFSLLSCLSGIGGSGDLEKFIHSVKVNKKSILNFVDKNGYVEINGGWCYFCKDSKPHEGCHNYDYESLIKCIEAISMLNSSELQLLTTVLNKSKVLDKEALSVLLRLAGRMAGNDDFTEMVNRIQFNQPLCSRREAVSDKEINYKLDEAIIYFFCNQFSRNDNIYLADLIRKAVNNQFEYLTAGEMRDLGIVDSIGKEVYTTRVTD